MLLKRWQIRRADILLYTLCFWLWEYPANRRINQEFSIGIHYRAIIMPLSSISLKAFSRSFDREIFALISRCFRLLFHLYIKYLNLSNYSLSSIETYTREWKDHC